MCYSSNTGLMCSGLRRLDRLASFFWGSRDDLRIEEAGEEENQTEEGPPRCRETSPNSLRSKANLLPVTRGSGK